MLENEKIIAKLTQGKINSSEALQELYAKRATDGSGLVMATSIAVCDKDGNILEKTSSGFGDWENTAPVSPDDFFRIYSATKTFTSEVIRQQFEDKKLHPFMSVKEMLQAIQQDPLMQSRYGKDVLAEILGSLKFDDKATVIDLLMHTSGLASYAEGGIDKNNIPFRQSVFAAPDKKWSMPELLQFTPSATSEYGKFKYSDSGYLLLTMIAEYIDHKSYEDIFKARCFDKYGLSKTCFVGGFPADAKVAEGYVRDESKPGTQAVSHIHYHTSAGTGGLFSTAEDMLKWMPAYLEREAKFFKSLGIAPAIMEKGAVPSHVGVAGYRLGSVQQTIEPEEQGDKAITLEGVGGYARGGRSKIFRDVDTGKSVVILETWENLTVEIAKELQSKPFLKDKTVTENVYALRKAYTDRSSKLVDRNQMINDYNNKERGIDFIAKKCRASQQQAHSLL